MLHFLIDYVSQTHNSQKETKLGFNNFITELLSGNIILSVVPDSSVS